MAKILFLGNGLNRLNNNQSWEQLLSDLIGLTGNNTIIRKDKPFPLLYEEILMNVLKNTDFKERYLIDKVINSIVTIQSNELHKKYAELSDTIITSNYDYIIEKNILQNPLSPIPKTTTKERVYSLFRKVEVEGKKVWHIH